MTNKRHIGLALGGGGTRGSYQIGMIQALCECGLKDYIKASSGTSIGAINTLLLLSEEKSEKLYDLWLEIDGDYLFANGFTRFKRDAKGFYSIDALYRTLKEEVNIENVRKSPIMGFATAAKLLKGDNMFKQLMPFDMQKVVFNLNDFENPLLAALASSSIPVIFGPTAINGYEYVDGGFVDNCPLGPLLDFNCDVIFAAPLTGGFSRKRYKKEKVLIVNIESRILFRNKVSFNLLKFDPNAIKEKFLYGYFMTKCVLNKLTKMSLLVDAQIVFDSKENIYIDVSRKEERKIKKRVLKTLETDTSNMAL